MRVLRGLYLVGRNFSAGPAPESSPHRACPWRPSRVRPEKPLGGTAHTGGIPPARSGRSIQSYYQCQVKRERGTLTTMTITTDPARDRRERVLNPIDRV